MRPLFFQINKHWGTLEKMMIRECPQALNFWWSIAPLVNKMGAISISQKAIMIVMGVKSRTTVNKCAKYLHSKHLLLVGKVGNQNTYILNNKFINETHKQWSTKKLKSLGLTFPSNTFVLKDDNRSDYDNLREYVRCYKSGKLDLKNFKPIKKQEGRGTANRNGEWVHGKNQYSNKIHHAHHHSKHSTQNKSRRKPVKQHQTNKSHASRNASDLMANAKKARQLSMFSSHQDYNAKESSLYNKNKTSQKRASD